MPFSQVNGTEVFYLKHGCGEPLLLIPGLGNDHSYFGRGEPLLRGHFETILIDPRGIGKSRRDNVEYSTQLWADDYAALLDDLGYERAHILGSSLGGATACEFAVRHPDRVRSLITVGAFTELSRSVEINYSLRKKLIAKIGMGEEMAEFIGLWIMSRDFIETEAGERILQVTKDDIRQNPTELYVRFLDAILSLGRRKKDGPLPPLTARLKEITAPTLVMCADNDHFIPASLSKIIAENIKGAKYIEIPNGAHLPFTEAPEKSAQAVIEFVASLKQ